MLSASASCVYFDKKKSELFHVLTVMLIEIFIFVSGEQTSRTRS